MTGRSDCPGGYFGFLFGGVPLSQPHPNTLAALGRDEFYTSVSLKPSPALDQLAPYRCAGLKPCDRHPNRL
jgi:hypothetical protein